jgi:creatinine amidohydrolase
MNLQWQDLTAPELARVASSRDGLAVVHLAAVEQHGPHLPLSCDLDIGRGLMAEARARLPRDFPLLELPSMPIGASEEHLGFIGTLSIPPENAIAAVESVGEAVARAGIRRLILFNSHGGNIAWMETAALRLRRRHGMLVIKLTYTRLGAPPGGLAAREIAQGIHGGALETALMRHFAPDKVREEHVADFRWPDHDSVVTPTGKVTYAWLAEDLNSEGAVGDASAGSAEMGAQLARFYADRMVEVFLRARDMPWPPEGPPGEGSSVQELP